ncbi:MAG: hypothetical protein WD794_07540 [Mycobacteriales bacterium]
MPDDMAEDLLFDEAERARLAQRTLDRVLDRLDEGDVEGARTAARHMFNEFESMHRLYRRWVTATLTEVVRRWGRDALAEVLEAGVRAWWLPNLRKLMEGTDDVAQRVRWFASGLRGHLVGLTVREDAEKIVIEMAPCGSGGRLLMEGGYTPPDDFASLAAEPALTYGLPDCPVYCAHQPLMEKLSVERYGHPFVVIEPAAYCTTRRPADVPPPELAREHCAFVVYKDPTRIPARYYERIGLTPPTREESPHV